MTDKQPPHVVASNLQTQLADLRASLRKRYKAHANQVVAQDLRDAARVAAEAWLAELAAIEHARRNIEPEVYANLTVEFEHLLQASQKATTRKVYDSILKKILDRFQLDVVIVLKRSSSSALPSAPASNLIVPTFTVPTVFVGHSFLPEDAIVASAVVGSLRAVGLQVFTGEKPKAGRISDKVKELIDSQDIFVGIFTRRDKLKGKDEWTTTTWVIEEKTWAMAKGKDIILLREQGVKNLGGLHADHEYLEFSREELGVVIVQLLQMFDIQTRGLR